jgi:bifunctional DNA-binding transcriptional regulator/antitoxin component of YhaV-PrlF toxin-antitoxin module
MKKTPTQERIGRVGQRRQVVIPREMLEALKLRAGHLVAFAERDNGVPIKPKRVGDPDDTLTPAEAKIARRGEVQLKRGESKPLASRQACAFELSFRVKPKSSFLSSRAMCRNA